MKSIREYLEDMLTYIGYLEGFAAEGRDTLESDIKTRLAVQKSFEILGEVAKRLPDDLLNQQPHIPWKQIKGFRDVLTHQYDSIDIDIVWSALGDLAELRLAVEALLNDLPEDEEE